MRHAKIIATVGPAGHTDAVLDALVAAGTNIFRLNFSHGTHDWHREVYARSRGGHTLRPRSRHSSGPWWAENYVRDGSTAAGPSR